MRVWSWRQERVDFLDALPEPSDSYVPPPLEKNKWSKQRLKHHYVTAKMRSAKAEKARASTIKEQAAMLFKYADNSRKRGRHVSLLNSVPFAKTKRNLGLRLVIRRAGLASERIERRRPAVTFEQMLEAVCGWPWACPESDFVERR